ncbi:hypothetical protein HD806DRAFT_505331 [Xylariaceae sp. AK1471]|nr:hypothetical protein HD806DRAFT_505331 [Xylariaceae sp. AK1471]
MTPMPPDLPDRNSCERLDLVHSTQPTKGRMAYTLKTTLSTSPKATPKLATTAHTQQTTGSPNFKFFGLPAEIRNEIYQGLLVPGHPLYLVQATRFEPVRIFAGDWSWAKSTRILRVNRQAHHEATAVLYGRNQFAVAAGVLKPSSGVLHHFLTRIGPATAGLLTNLCVNFPLLITNPQAEAITLGSLRLLQQTCIGLKTLEFLDHRVCAGAVSRDTKNDDRLVQEYLPQVDTLLEAIPSLEKVIVNARTSSLSSSVIEAMQSFGWVVMP